MKKVMIYGTLGPACGNREILRQMAAEGMDGMRLNLSHITLEDAAPWIEAYRTAAADCGKAPLLLIDLQGPELRIGSLEAPLRLERGARIETEAIPFSDEVRQTLERAPIGQEVLLDDGKLLLQKEADGLRVLRGGVLESRKSAALVGCSLCAPALTETDRRHLRLAKSFGVTAVMQPFVRGSEDLLSVRRALIDAGCGDLRLFAKIENADGVAHLEELIPCCDEIVIARGDLGNAVPLWELPAVQKRIAAACREANRDFTVVTQMLDSMTHRPVPTRAEVSDIFNAVLDGAASVMVTGETASGDYPVETIRYLARTVRAAQAYIEL